MKRAIVLTHASFEGPGRLEGLLVNRGYTLDTRELHRGDLVPEGVSREDVLVVMGGPMGVGDLGRPGLPFLQREVELLSRCIDEDAPVLGVCLGAQLLAFAARARVHQMVRDGERSFEVGWAPISFHRAGDADPILHGLPEEAHVLHWHGDMFELPARARRLASTALCANQGFRLRSRLFGLQFHCEIEARNVEDFLRADGDFVQRANGNSGIERIRSDTEKYVGSCREVGDRLLGNILDVMTRDSI